LVNTYFTFKILGYVKKESFNPPPRTTSAIIVLKTKPQNEMLSNPSNFIFRELFLSAGHGSLVRNKLREAIIKYKDNQNKSIGLNQHIQSMTKNEARKIVTRLELPEDILEKSFEQLSNNEIFKLAVSLKVYNFNQFNN